jgi:hypothetical protein
VLERKLPDIDLRVLVDLPAGLDYNEWLASHSKRAFSLFCGMEFITIHQIMAYDQKIYIFYWIYNQQSELVIP